MRDPKRIDKVLAKVKELWEKFPDWRLAQLIGNFAIYYTEDEDLVKSIDEFLINTRKQEK